MGYAQVVRRVIHISSPVFLIYYFLPEEIAGVPKRFGVILVMILTLWLDGIRILKGWVIPGARPYEKHRISSASWAGLGMMVAFLYFPEEYVVPVLFGMAWIDPMMGEIRKRTDVNPVVIAIPVYMVLFVSIYSFFSISWNTLLFGVIASLSACTIEHYGPLWLDDDFSMVFIPLLVLDLVRRLPL